MMPEKHTGFTLIEVAIVMLIIAVLVSAAILPLRGQRHSANVAKAREDIAYIEEALYGFAIANNRLPCPTQPGAGGIEQPVGGGACNQGGIGFVPAATLGLRGDVNCDGLLVDPWGRPYLYSVTTLGADAYTTAGGIATAGGIGALAPQTHLRICTDNTCGASLTLRAVGVIISLGRNTAASPDQDQNAGEAVRASGCLADYGVGNNDDYVYRDAVELAGQEFDDIVSWLSTNNLYAKLLAAGQL